MNSRSRRWMRRRCMRSCGASDPPPSPSPPRTPLRSRLASRRRPTDDRRAARRRGGFRAGLALGPRAIVLDAGAVERGRRLRRRTATSAGARGMTIGRRATLAGLMGLPALAQAQDTTAALRDLARRATIYLFPMYEMYRARWRATVDETNPHRQRLNRFRHLPALADSTMRDVTSPNADTLYSSAWLDLSLEPLFLTVPPVGDLYCSYAFIDLFTDNFLIVSPRLSGNGLVTQMIVGPKWNGDAPGDVTLVRAPDHLGMAARSHPGRRSRGTRPRAHPAESRAARDAGHAQRAAHSRDGRADALPHAGAARTRRRLAGSPSRRPLRPVRYRHAGAGRGPAARTRSGRCWKRWHR
jgi:hypothetical protein